MLNCLISFEVWNVQIIKDIISRFKLRRWLKILNFQTNNLTMKYVNCRASDRSKIFFRTITVKFESQIQVMEFHFYFELLKVRHLLRGRYEKPLEKIPTRIQPVYKCGWTKALTCPHFVCVDLNQKSLWDFVEGKKTFLWGKIAKKDARVGF